MGLTVKEVIARTSELRRAGDLEGAIAVLRQALRDTPDQLELMLLLALSLTRQGRDAEAVALYERAVARVPAAKAGRILAALAASYDALGRAEEAEAACRAALASEPTLVPPAMLLATLLGMRGVAGEALSLYRSIIDRVPQDQRLQIEQAMSNLERDGQLR